MAAYVISFICKAGSCPCSRLKQNKFALSSQVVRQENPPQAVWPIGMQVLKCERAAANLQRHPITQHIFFFSVSGQ